MRCCECESEQGVTFSRHYQKPADEFVTSFDEFRHLILNLEFSHLEAAGAPSKQHFGPWTLLCELCGAMTCIDEFGRSHHKTRVTVIIGNGCKWKTEPFMYVGVWHTLFSHSQFAHSHRHLHWHEHSISNPKSINMDLRSVCFLSVFAIVCAIACHSIACCVSYLSRFGRRPLAASHTWEDPRSAHVWTESWDVDDRRTDEHALDNSDSSEDDRVVFQGANLCRI